jgi:hypothetical protein
LRGKRRHSALLLLMAPVIAIGSSFVVAGNAGASAKNVKPTITVCKSVAGSFQFSVNGKSMSLSKQCTAVTAKAGVNHVTETSAPASYRNITSISVSPNAARVSTSVKTATATVKLAAHGAATVRFVNAEIVTQVINRTTGAKVAGTGYIEVCKYAADGFVEGSFPFTISSGGATVATVSVAVNSCSSDVAVPAGPVVVTEANEFPYEVTQASSLPTISVSGVTLGGGGSATFAVSANQAVSALFTDGTYLGYYKICKVLATDQGSLAGSIFNYTVNWTFTPPNGAAAYKTKPLSVSVVAVDASVVGGACSLPFGAPAGSVVTATENAFPDVAVSKVAIVPPGDVPANLTAPAGTALFTVPMDGSTASATFTNEPLGTIEICKNFDPWTYDSNYSAQFTVNGGASFWVNGGGCSAPITVPAGTATVSEASQANFYLESVSTVSATDMFGTRLLTGATVNPATFTVPYGGVGNETVVTFTNAVDLTQFKICKQETSADANLVGSTFEFTWSFKGRDGDPDPTGNVYLTIAPVTASNPTGLVCSGLLWGPPAVNSDGSVTPVSIVEDSTLIAAVEVTSIVYQGNGTVGPESALPAVVTGGTAGLCFDPGAGINVVTFTNGRTGGSS